MLITEPVTDNKRNYCDVRKWRDKLHYRAYVHPHKKGTYRG